MSLLPCVVAFRRLAESSDGRDQRQTTYEGSPQTQSPEPIQLQGFSSPASLLPECDKNPRLDTAINLPARFPLRRPQPITTA